MSYTLETVDKIKFEVRRDVVMQMIALRDLLEGGYQVPGEATPLPNVESSILEKIIEYCQKHVDHKVKPEKDMEEWDKRFINLRPKIILQIMKASNYLDVPDLYNLACQAYANLAEGKTVEEIRQIYSM